MAAPPSSLHKSRKKKKVVGPAISSTAGQGSIVHDPDTTALKPAFPLAAFLWPARGVSSQWVVLPLVLMVAGLFRWAVGLWGYSGFESPPMHGDFEAQRHWMEITTRLPISQWYFHDLKWWGLDYPPLTAYHSWVLGMIGSLINPSWFELYTSRGLDDPTLKIYMRATVLVSEYLLYVPPAVVLLRRLSRLEGVHIWDYSIALVALLLQPATMLIDHAHFQYNTVMLGFVLCSMSSLMAGNLLWGCVFFVAALGFKQMALYYAPAIFAYLLGVCIFPRIRIARLFNIALITILSFSVVFAPLGIGALYDAHRGIPPNPDLSNSTIPILHPMLSSLPIPLGLQISPTAIYYPPLHLLAQSIYRIFPFDRGLFEDKVANVWCALNVFIKLRNYPISTLQRLSLLTTLAAILPPCIIIFLKPKKTLLPLALATTAWGFFLCSFQVHEKSVLLPLLPMTLLLATRGGFTPQIRAWVAWTNMLGCWTMFPLLSREGLRIPYFVCTLLWGYIIGIPGMYPEGIVGGLWWPVKVLHGEFYLGMIAWHLLEYFIEPPQGKPDLWTVANVGLGAVGFGCCYLWCLWRLVVISGITDGRKRKVGEKSKAKVQ